MSAFEQYDEQAAAFFERAEVATSQAYEEGRIEGEKTAYPAAITGALLGLIGGIVLGLAFTPDWICG